MDGKWTGGGRTQMDGTIRYTNINTKANRAFISDTHTITTRQAHTTIYTALNPNVPTLTFCV